MKSNVQAKRVVFNKSIRHITALGLAMAIVAAGSGIHVLVPSAQADVTAAWSLDNNGNFSAGANWIGGNAPTGTTGVAYFTNAITANRTVTVDTSPWTIGGLTFANTAAFGFTLANGTLESLTTIVVNSSSAATVGSVISGSAGLTLSGGGVLTLSSGTNTITDPLTVSGGSALHMTNPNAFTNALPVITLNNGSIGWKKAGGFTNLLAKLTPGSTGSIILYQENATESIDLTGFPNITVRFQGAFNYTGTITLDPAATALLLAPENGMVITCSQTLTNSLALIVNGVGNGMVDLTGDNSTWTNSITVNGGRLSVSHVNGLGDGTGPITINSNAYLRINAAVASSFTSRITSGSQGYISLQTASASVNIDLTGCPGVYLGTDLGTLNYAGTITPAPDGVYRLGGGNQVFRGQTIQGFVANLTGGVDTVIMQGLVRITNSTCTGNTIITNNGVLYVSGDAAFGAVPASPTANNIQLDTGGAIRMGEYPVTVTLNANRGVQVGSGGGEFHTWGSRTLTVPGNLSGTGTLTFTDGGTTIFSGINSAYSGTMDIQAGSTVIGNGTTFSWNKNANVTGTGGRFGVNANANLLWTTDFGIPLGSANPTRNNFSLLKLGTGTLTVDVAQSYQQDTDIEGGMVKVANAAAIPSGIGKGNVDFANNAILDVNGNNITVNALTGAGRVIDSASTANQITLGANNNTWTLAAPITNSLSIVKTGTGIMTLAVPTSKIDNAVRVDAGTISMSVSMALDDSLDLNGTGTTLSLTKGSYLGTNGLTAYYYFGVSGTAQISSYAVMQNRLATVAPSVITTSLVAGDTCNYGEDTSKINGGDNYVLLHHGRFMAETSGTYTFGLSSDDGATLFIDGALVVDHNVNGPYNATPQATGSVYLTAGLHEVMMGMYEGGGGQGLTLFCQTPGQGSLAAIPNSLLLQDVARIANLIGTGKIEAIATPNVTPLELVANTASTFSGSVVAAQGIYIVKSGTAKQTMALTANCPTSTVWDVRTGELEFTTQPNRGALMISSGATVSLTAATIPSPSMNGLMGSYYTSRTDYNQFLNLAAFKNYLAGVTPVHTFSTTYNGKTGLDFGTGGAGFPPPYNGTDYFFQAFWEGLIRIPETGAYTFYTNSDDGSMVFIDGQAVVDNSGGHAMQVRSGTITLTAGLHSFALNFYNSGGGFGLTASISGPNLSQQFIPNSMLIPVSGSVTGISGAGSYSLNNSLAHEVMYDAVNRAFSGSLSGASTTYLSKAGPATWTLTGDSSGFEGTINVAGGVLNLVGTVSLGGTIINNGEVALHVTEDRTFNMSAGGNGSLVKNEASTVTIKLNGSAFEQQLTVNAGRVLFDNQGREVIMTKQPIVNGTGSWGVVGAGNTTLSGGTNALSTVSGEVLIDTGKLTLVGIPVSEGLVVALDASRTNSIYVDSTGAITNWTSQVSNINFSHNAVANCPTYNPNAFNGRGAVVFGSNYLGSVTSTRLNSSKTTTNKTVFIVTRMTGTQNTWSGIWGRTGYDLGGIRPENGTTQWRIYGDGNDFCNGAGGRAFVNGIEKFGNTEVGTTGHILTQYAGNDAIWSSSILTSVGHYHYIGQPDRYYKGEIAELLVYDRYVTDAERAAIETYLNAKWLGGASGPAKQDVLPTGVSLELANNGTLDLNGAEQTFSAVTGSGTITNGNAIVTDDIRPGGTGVIGTLGFAGFEQQTATYYADLDQNSEAPCDQVVISGTGSVSLTDLTININLLAAPGSITRFKVMSTLGTFTGAPTLTGVTTYWSSAIGDSGKSLYLIYSSGTVLMFK